MRAGLRTTLVSLLVAGVSPAAAQQSHGGPALALDAALSGIYDSNIERDQTDLGLYGGGIELLARYANRASRPSLQLEYSVVRRVSSPVALESPFGQRATALLAAPVAGGVRLELIGRGSSGSVDEDMNPGRELSLMPRLELEPGSAHRLRLYGTAFWRFNQAARTPGYQAGADYRVRTGERATLLTGYRYERLEPLDSTRAWYSSAGTLELATRLMRTGTLELSGRYRIRDYPSRFITVGDERTPRRDTDWRAGAAWVYRNESGTEVRLGYEQDVRTSNDVRRSYDARRVLLTVRQTVFRLRSGNARRIDDDLSEAPLSFTGLAALDAHVCGVTSAGAAHCWPAAGEAPGARAKPIRSPTGEAWVQLAASPRTVCGITTRGAAYCWRPGDAAPLLAPIRGARVFTSIAVGDDHVCALSADARAFCWGSNRDGALGNGTLEDSWEPVAVAGVTFRSLAAGARHMCGVAMDHAVYCWGSNAHGQLGVMHEQRITTPARVDTLLALTVSAGNSHSCAVDLTGRAWCWGENARGQLGNGNTTKSPEPQLVRSDARFVAIAAGWAHTCALTDQGLAHCWGQNRYGQLGTGRADEHSHTVPERVLGHRTFRALRTSFRTCGLRATGTVECWGTGVTASPAAVSSRSSP